MRNCRCRSQAERRELFEVFRRSLLHRAVFDDNHVTAKWRRRFGGITRTQNGEGFRAKGDGEEDRDCRTLHSLVLICINHAMGAEHQYFCGERNYRVSHQPVMRQASTEVLSQSRSWPSTTSGYKRVKTADSRIIGSEIAPQMHNAKSKLTRNALPKTATWKRVIRTNKQAIPNAANMWSRLAAI